MSLEFKDNHIKDYAKSLRSLWKIIKNHPYISSLISSLHSHMSMITSLVKTLVHYQCKKYLHHTQEKPIYDLFVLRWVNIVIFAHLHTNERRRIHIIEASCFENSWYYFWSQNLCLNSCMFHIDFFYNDDGDLEGWIWVSIVIIHQYPTS
jgi:hypothetical protein